MDDADALPPPSGEPIEVADDDANDHVRPAWAPLTLVAFIGLVICTNIANAIWVRLVGSTSAVVELTAALSGTVPTESGNPELLLALSSRNRYLALALGSDISILAYAVIGFARILLAFMVCHLIGRAYSRDAVGWFKRYLGFNDEAEATFDRGFEKAEWALIPLFSGSNIVGVLTGVRQTPWPKLVSLLSIGIIGRLTLMWALARFFDDQLDAFIAVTTRYQWWVLGASVLVVVAVNMKNFRRR